MSCYYLIELQMGSYLVAVVLQQDTAQKSHKITHTTLEQSTAHKATQAVKDTLHPVNTTQNSEAVPVTGRGGVLIKELSKWK
jgi:tRNA A22 N-methylase